MINSLNFNPHLFKKFLVSRDLDQIDMGIELLVSLNNKELFESLLHDCKITISDDSYKNQKLVCNKTFTGSGPAQPYLNYSLFNVIANAPADVKMDDSIQIQNITDLDTDTFSLKDGWSRFKRFLNFEIIKQDLSVILVFRRSKWVR